MTDSDDQALARMMRGAGPRTPVPADVRARMQNVLTAELAAVRARRSRRRITAGFAAAACIVVALGLVYLAPTAPAPAPIDVARVDRQQGQAHWIHDELKVPVGKGNTIRSGDRIATADGGLALAPLQMNVDVRLGPHTGVTFWDEHTILLHRGALYVDAEPGDGPAAPLVVIARDVTIRHVGTQYLVTTDGTSDVSVAVRQGAVRVLHDAQEVTMQADADARLVSFDAAYEMTETSIEPWGGRWSWTTQNAPALPSGRMRLTDFLDWVSHETGYGIEYASARVAAEVVNENRLIVGIDTHDVFDALHSVMLADRFNADVRRGRIVISLETSLETPH
jgi:hypothetical protein